MYNRRTLFAAVLMLATLCLSLLFIAVHADHDCIGEDCPVCAVIRIVHSCLHSINTNTVASFIKHSFFILHIVLLCVFIAFVRATPVTQKVKLNT